MSAPDAVYPLNRIVQIDRDEVGDDLELAVIFRDANVRSQLQIEVFVIRGDGTSIFVPQQMNNTILPTTSRSFERSTTISVPVAILGVGCSKIELLVSQEFADVSMPREMGDLHSAVWWVAVTSSGAGAIDLRECRQ